MPLDTLGSDPRVDLQRVALQGSGEDAPALLRVYEFTVHILVFVFFLDEVQAVVHEAQRYTGRFHAPVIELRLLRRMAYI